MKISKSDLVELIYSKVFKTSNLLAFEKIEEDLVSNGKFTLVEFLDFKSDKNTLLALDIAELYWIISSASKHLQSIKKEDYYFEDAEIQKFRFYTKNTIESFQYPIVFENVEELTPNENRQFGFYLSVKQISMLKRCGMLGVIPNLQRGGVKNKYGDLVIDVKPKRYSEIKKVIETGRYFFDQIKINLINDEYSNFEYDPESRELTIFSGTMIIPDGNHRATACEIIDLKNINTDNKFSIAFTFLTPAQTQSLLAQTWNMEPIKQRKKKSMEATASNKILDYILRNEDADPLYVDNIVKGAIGNECQNGFILYDILSNAIKKYYNTNNLESQDERTEISNWLIKFFNKLTSILISDFKNYRDIRHKRWSVDTHVSVGYIMLSRYLFRKDSWADDLKRIILSIDFNLANSPVAGKTSQNVKVKAIEKFFNEVISNENNV